MKRAPYSHCCALWNLLPARRLLARFSSTNVTHVPWTVHILKIGADLAHNCVIVIACPRFGAAAIKNLGAIFLTLGSDESHCNPAKLCRFTAMSWAFNTFATERAMFSVTHAANISAVSTDLSLCPALRVIARRHNICERAMLSAVERRVLVMATRDTAIIVGAWR